MSLVTAAAIADLTAAGFTVIQNRNQRGLYMVKDATGKVVRVTNATGLRSMAQ